MSTRALWIRGRSDGSDDVTSRGRVANTASRARACATSSRIVATRSSTESKRSVGRRWATNSNATSSPYRSRSVRSSTYASTRRVAPSNVGLVPTEIAAGSTASAAVARAEPAQPAGVHAVGRDHPGDLRSQVRRREAERAPPGVAVHDDAAHPVRAAQDGRGLGDAPVGEQLARPGRGPGGGPGPRSDRPRGPRSPRP